MLLHDVNMPDSFNDFCIVYAPPPPFKFFRYAPGFWSFSSQRFVAPEHICFIMPVIYILLFWGGTRPIVMDPLYSAFDLFIQLVE